MIFKMLTIFKSINNGTQVAEWQQAFSQKYQDLDFSKIQGWSYIEKWINSKPNDEKKQALQSIASYASYNEAEVKNYTPTLCYVDANNVLTQIKAAL
jgi:hypothetical protein